MKMFKIKVKQGRWCEHVLIKWQYIDTSWKKEKKKKNPPIPVKLTKILI